MKKDKQPEQVCEQPMSYDEYAALPDDGNRYELANGVLELMSPSPAPDHQLISGRMFIAVTQTCENEYLIFMDTDVVLSPHEVRRPDLVMIRRDRIGIVTKRRIKGPPDLVVEILSPHSLRRDKVSKLHSYAKHGVKEYWIVDPPNCALEQYVLAGASYELADVYARDEAVQSPHIPCVSFTMEDIMSRIPELPEE